MPRRALRAYPPNGGNAPPLRNLGTRQHCVQSSWNVMAHGDAPEGKWRGNWRMECRASIIHTTSEHGVSSITTADAHISAASSRLNWRPHRFKWTRPFRRKTKSGFCACAIIFQTQSTFGMTTLLVRPVRHAYGDPHMLLTLSNWRSDSAVYVRHAANLLFETPLYKTHHHERKTKLLYK